MNDVKTSNPQDNPHTPGPQARRQLERIRPNEPDRLLPRNLRPAIERQDARRQAELDKKKLSPAERQQALHDGRSQVYALRDEWVQMQRFLSQQTLDYITSRPPESTEQLLKMRVFSSINLDRVDNQGETVKRHIEMINRWVEIQKIMDADQAGGMRARVNKLNAETMRDFLTGKMPVEDLQDKRDKGTQERFLEKEDIKRLLPFVLSEVEQRRLRVIEEKLGQDLRRLAASPREDERRLAANIRVQLKEMDPGIYYNMLLGKIMPYELRRGLPAEATGVTWELVRMAYTTKDDMQQILRGENLKTWQDGYAHWAATIEQRGPELDREWQTMQDHFYRERPTTYNRLELMPEEMRRHLLSIDLSPEHEVFTLRGHLQQVISMLHPDDLYPFLQYRTKGLESTFGANASWLRFQDIVHRLHERVETGKTQCVGVDFFTGLPLYPPSRYSMIVLGVPGGGKTDNFVYVNLVQHQSGQEALIIVDIKGDSTQFAKEYLHKRNLGELTGMAAGALSVDHRVMIIGPGADEGNLNILWYIPTTQEAETKIAELKTLLEKETSEKSRTVLQAELNKANEDLVSLKRKQHQMAVKIGAAWARAGMKQDELKNLGHTNPALRKLYYQTIIAGMLHLRLSNPDLPPLMDLRLINNLETLEVLKDSPSDFAQDTYKRIDKLGDDQKAALISILSASTAMLDDPLVQEFTRTNSLDYEALLRPEEGKMPWAVAVNVHQELNSAEMLNPIFESAFETWHEVHKYAKIHSPDIHSNKVFFLIDEGKNFASNSSSGKIHPKIEEFVDIMRSLDARFLGSTQSPDPHVIPPDILGKVTLLIGSPDDETARYIAEKIGITSRDMLTSSNTNQFMVGQQNGERRHSIGWGFTATESAQWRDTIQLMEGHTAQELPLVYPHNLTQLPRNLGIMVVPGLAPALYIPLNPRESVVLKALRRIEPVIEPGSVMDSLTPKDMAAQLTPPKAAASPGVNVHWKEEELTEVISHLEEERRKIEEKNTNDEKEEIAKSEQISVINQIIGGLTKTLKQIRDDTDERRRREKATDNS